MHCMTYSSNVKKSISSEVVALFQYVNKASVKSNVIKSVIKGDQMYQLRGLDFD